MKIDGFGLEHREECRWPEWGIAEVLRAGAGRLLVQRCRGCGLLWRSGDPAGPPQRRVGYTRRDR